MNANKNQLADYLNQPLPCQCGRTHFAGIRTVDISRGALKQVTKTVKADGFKKPFVFSDSNTHEIAGKTILEQFEAEGIHYKLFVFDDTSLSPDEGAVGQLLMNFDPDCDLIIGVGSGTINDLARFFSYQMGLEYYIVATAPSMDGYASTVAPLIKNNLKTTFECHVASAIIADLDIVANAPAEMIAAGFGDVVGKYTCLADWKLSAIINGEYYCEKVVDLTLNSLERTIKLGESLAAGDPDAMAELMEALVLSGISMSYVGNSRPASGAEHHLAHFWEMKFLWAGREAILHGTKVGIAAVIVSRLYQLLSEADLDPKTFSEIVPPISDDWTEDIKAVYLDGAAEVLRLEETAKKNDPQLHRERIISIAKHWDEIQETLKIVPSSDVVEQLLKAVNAPTEPAEVGISGSLVREALLFAKELRPRYTILQLLWDLDMLTTFTDQLLN